jgi:hypothetical protein
MKKTCPFHSTILEILETRIAPATFLVTSDALQILDAADADATGAPNEAAAEAISLSDAVVFLATGDKLFFDANGIVATPLLKTEV